MKLFSSTILGVNGARPIGSSQTSKHQGLADKTSHHQVLACSRMLFHAAHRLRLIMACPSGGFPLRALAAEVQDLPTWCYLGHLQGPFGHSLEVQKGSECP